MNRKHTVSVIDLFVLSRLVIVMALSALTLLSLLLILLSPHKSYSKLAASLLLLFGETLDPVYPSRELKFILN